MESLYLLIPISLVFIVIAIRIFFWAVNSGQYDDLDSEGERILFESEEPQEQQEIVVKNKRAVKNKKEQT